jgi:hypothetical protein
MLTRGRYDEMENGRRDDVEDAQAAMKLAEKLFP